MSSACEGCAEAKDCGRQDSCEKRNGTAKLDLSRGSSIKCVIAVGSGKGGVGKSFVTSALAHKLSSKGLKVGIMDADITGPSIPGAFGLKDMLTADDDNRIIPSLAKDGIKVVSLNLLLEDENSPVIWRGPVLSGLIRQFWTDVCWGELDVLLIDMPPGTGDIPLTVFQSLPIDGFVLVSSPQQLVSMIVSKARNMASMMNVRVLGLVENMAYINCPDCGKRISLFGDDEALVESMTKAGIPILDTLPLVPSDTALVDSGRIYDLDAADMLNGTADAVLKFL